MSTESLHYAGWDATTGRPSVARLPERGALLAAIDAEHEKVARPAARDAPPPDDPRDPLIGRWSIVVVQEDLELAREAFAPLIELRRQQGSVREPRGGETPGIIAVRPPSPRAEETKWIERIEEASPGRMPYFLLLAGGPDKIPFEAQAVLDERRATGRIDVGDTPSGPFSWEACRAYADKVVAYETGKLQVAREAVVYSFATDEATRDAHQGMSVPVKDYLEGKLGPSGCVTLFDREATTQGLLDKLAARSPALVITASHGVEMAEDAALWGALTDYTFFGSSGCTPLSAHVVPRTRFAAGAVMLAFACFSAGAPKRSAHRLLTREGDVDLPCGQRTAALPRALLAHPQGPVAFAGHVDRATSYSFQSSPGRVGSAAFQNFAGWCLHESGTLGRAMSTFHEHGMDAASRLARLTSPALRASRSEDEVVDAWIAYHDLSGYILLGDPVIRPALALSKAT